MKNNIRQIFINLGVTFVTLVLVCLFFEFLVFQYILLPSELPALDSGSSVLKYEPDQKGVFREQNEVEAQFRINHNGWNSGKKEYLIEKTKPRIALIGDSYVEALQVGSDASLAEKLEDLGRGSFEVYRFGISGAPLSQYLHMLREEVVEFKPDLVIFNLVHNDFDESYGFMPGVFTSSFLKLKMDGDQVVGEIPPDKYLPRWYDPIRRSNTWRYLSSRQQIRFQGLRQMVLGTMGDPSTFQANINVASVKDKNAENRAACEYVFREAKDLCEQSGARFMLVMDGVRQVVYRNPEGPFDRTQGALLLNTVVESTANTLNIPYIDLHDVFAKHYRQNGQKFEFECDGHWNELGHEVAAQAIFNALQKQPSLLGQ